MYHAFHASYSNFLVNSARKGTEMKKIEEDAFFAGQIERLML
jgi:hypothetical protein